ncbi:MAG: acyl-CoA dehydrogenase family protein [Deltaproteobacteria bacterium]|nr:acyl-CoA dehydrogenase family protein [Deltaproteobacteria bacterium]
MRTPELTALYEGTLRIARAIDARADGERFDRSLWRECAASGLLGLGMPAAFGGSGGGAMSIAVGYEAFGYGCRDNGLAFSLASQLLSVQMPLVQLGSETLQQRYLPGLVSGDLIAAHASTEADAGSDVNRVQTVARAVDGGWCLTGAKIYSSLAPVADIAVVLARIDDGSGKSAGLAEFVVPRESYAVSKPIEKIGLHSSPFGELTLDDAFVPADHVLGHAGSGLMGFMSTMEWERALILAFSVGAMHRELDGCVRYAKDRKQFGFAIGSFQAVAHRIAHMRVRLETARLMLERAAETKDRGGRAALEACMTKLHISEARCENALDAVRVYGAFGCTTESGVERELRDAVPGLIYSGTSDIQRNTIARLLGLLSKEGS